MFELTQAMILKAKLWLLTHTGTFDSLSGSINWAKAKKQNKTKHLYAPVPFTSHMYCASCLFLCTSPSSLPRPPQGGVDSHFESLCRLRRPFVFRLRHLMRVHGETHEGTQQVNDYRIDDDDNDDDEVEYDDPNSISRASRFAGQQSVWVSALRVRLWVRVQSWPCPCKPCWWILGGCCWSAPGHGGDWVWDWEPPQKAWTWQGKWQHTHENEGKPDAHSDRWGLWAMKCAKKTKQQQIRRSAKQRASIFKNSNSGPPEGWWRSHPLCLTLCSVCVCSADGCITCVTACVRRAAGTPGEWEPGGAGATARDQ